MEKLTQVRCHRNEYIHPLLRQPHFLPTAQDKFGSLCDRLSSGTTNQGQQTPPAQGDQYQGDDTEPTPQRQTVHSETIVQFSRARRTTPCSGRCVWQLKVCVCSASAAPASQPSLSKDI